MNILNYFKKITTFVLDVDGVLTNGTINVMPDGSMVRSMNVKDGYALQLAIKKGYHILIISGGNAPEVQVRLNKLGIKNVFMQADDKLSILKNFATEHSLLPEQILFMGDDIPDYDAMHFAGLPCCPANAVWDIKNICKYISPFSGGEGCARDVLEKVLKLNDHWILDTHIKAQ